MQDAITTPDLLTLLDLEQIERYLFRANEVFESDTVFYSVQVVLRSALSLIDNR